jgi:hypothetical protein
MAFCLTGKYADQFIEKLKSGEIDPAKLSKMTSQERRDFFRFAGPMNASNINALFESKLLLKNQQQGMITWAKQAAGMKPEVLRDLLSIVNKMDKPLNPETKQAFLEDLVAHRLKAKVTMEQATKISEMAKDIAKKKELMNSGLGDRMAYGRATVAFGNYVNGLKESAKKIPIGEQLKPSNWAKGITNIGGISRSLKASMDNSALFRQGWKTLWTNPGIWTKNSIKSFADIGKTIGGKAALDEVRADIISRPNYNRMKKAKLAVATIEEEFPSGLPEKIPAIGRVYKATQDAYTGFLYRQRADIFDKYMEIAEKSDIDIDDRMQLESIGKLVNSLTGRGNLGFIEPAANIVNNVFFSPRLLKSHIDVLTMHLGDKKVSGFVKWEAAKNLVKIVSGTAAVLVIANAASPGSVEKDPKSADFGKIKIGDTRFDVSGGMASIVTLAFRQITNSTKSSTTGLVSQLGTGKFGSSTRASVFYNFFENKLAPLPGAINNYLKAEDFTGKKPTTVSTLKDLFVPIIGTNYQELKDDPESADKLLTMIAEGLGISTSTYSANTNWEDSTGVELQQFKKVIGDIKFKEANEDFNKRFNSWFKLNQTNPEYKALSDEDKQKVITKKKNEIKAAIFKQYIFKYKAPKVKPLPNF